MYLLLKLLFALAAGSTLVAAVPHELVKRADLRAFDVSRAQSPYRSDFWVCAHNAGYGKAIIRAYQQACGSGGQVDPNFVPAYKAAKAAGFAHVDGYMFPCTGTQSQRACKSPQTQINELLTTIKANNVIVDYLWFDIEPTSGVCNAWNLGATANLNLANQWIAALRATGLKWGIYANGNQWSSIFPSRSTNVASDFPLWAVQFDRQPGVSTVTTFMGGWTRAFAKQYYLDTTTPECSGSLDLDSFAA